MVADNASRLPRQQGKEQGGRGGSRQEESSGGMVGSVVEGAGDIASTAAGAVGDAWDATRQGAQQAASTVADVAENAWEETRDFMRRYPMAALGAGFCLGFLMAMAMGGPSLWAAPVPTSATGEQRAAHHLAQHCRRANTRWFARL